MKKIEEIRNPDSCFNKAYNEELIFVLLERDPAAAVTIEAWITARITLGKNSADDAQIKEARAMLCEILKRHS
jgi:hypothetical protein